jgi:hypothetical protein
MRRRSKILSDGFVTSLARFRADELRPGNAGWCENGAIRLKRAARKENDGERGCSRDCPQQFFALTVEPSS